MKDTRIPLEIAYTGCSSGLDEDGDAVSVIEDCEFYQANDIGDCKFSGEMCLSAERNIAAIKSDMEELEAQYREIESIFQEGKNDETE